MKLGRHVASLLFAVTATSHVAAQSARPATPAPDALERMNQAVDALTRKVWPSVVQIQVTGLGVRDDRATGEVSAIVTTQRSVGSGKWSCRRQVPTARSPRRWQGGPRPRPRASSG